MVYALNVLVTKTLPGFNYCSIQASQDLVSVLHEDSNNVGPSAAYAAGNFTGGELWCNTPAPGGQRIDIREQLIQFDGQKHHRTMPFSITGEQKGDRLNHRWSFAFFSPGKYHKMTPKHRLEL